MSAALGAGGWAAALLLCARWLGLRRRFRLVALACHELRGPATAIALAAAALRREPEGERRALTFEVQIDRMQAALADLDLARRGRRAAPRPTLVPLDRLLRGTAAGWEPVIGAAGRRVRVRSRVGDAVVRADRRRLAQVLGNLLANAAEHGSGTVELAGRRSGDRVVLEVRDAGSDASGAEVRPEVRGRGHGLGIAAAGAEEAGGDVRLRRGRDGTVAALELPLAER